MMLQSRDLWEFRKLLLGWFRQFQRDLPWRRNKDPYRIWLSEIMLQQTRVAAVIPYYERFLERFPDIDTLAEAPRTRSAAVLVGARLLQPRAQFAARGAADRRKARRKVSANRGCMRLRFPGIGSYTAAAILEHCVRR